MKKYLLLALLLLLPSQTHAARFFGAFQTGLDANAGTATTSPWQTWAKFSATSRTAGDLYVLRRGEASTTNTGNIGHTSDGTALNPLIITADNDNYWGDFSTSSQTYAVAVATSTFTASGNITGIEAGDWVYVAGDCYETYNSAVVNTCKFYYEVASVSGTQLILYLPYKGNQTGSGLSLRRMPPNPIQGAVTAGGQPQLNTDNFWYIKGMDVRSSMTTGALFLAASYGELFEDDIFQSNATTSAIGISNGSTGFEAVIKKSRFYNYISAIGANNTNTYGKLNIYDSLFDGANAASSQAFITALASTWNIFCTDCYFRNHASSDIEVMGPGSINVYRNPKFMSATPIQSNAIDSSIAIEDYNGNIGDNRYSDSYAGANTNTAITLSTTSVSLVRTAGGTSIQVIPSANTGQSWDTSIVKIMSVPVYDNTTSRTFNMYVMSTSTSNFTANPTVSATSTQLWVECDSWQSPTNDATSTRKIAKSTGTVSFTTLTTWQAIPVTCAATNTGLKYINAYYSKPKESTASNVFFVDNKVDITP